jgi:hypothetical protein
MGGKRNRTHERFEAGAMGKCLNEGNIKLDEGIILYKEIDRLPF